MPQTLTVLGGGSAYTPGLIAALIHHANSLSLKQIRLFDTDNQRLSLVATLCDAMATSQQAGFRVQAASSLKDAIAGTDVVLNSTRPGGLSARRIDETLPLEFDIPGQETVGPGGFFFALRSVPKALEVAALMRVHAPDAVLLNYTNPTNIVTQALLDKGGGVRVLGLCDQSDEDLLAVCEALGQPGEPYSFTTLGLNHATFYHDIRIANEPLASLPENLTAPKHFDHEHALRFSASLAIAHKHEGVWPNSYIPYYTSPKTFVAHANKVGPRSDVIVASLPDYYAHFASEAQKSHPQLLRHRGSAGFGDLAVRVLIALDSTTPTRIVLNVRNQGITPVFDAHTVIECQVDVASSGVVPVPAPGYPREYLPLISRLERYQQAAAQAAVSGSLADATAALAENPLVADATVAAKMMQRAQALYGPNLPLFA